MRAIPAEKGAENFKLREVETTFGVAVVAVQRIAAAHD